LWVFDFDWTVVDENSDTWIQRCAPGGALPPAVKDSYIPPDWVGYMNRVLSFLAEHGVTPNDLQAQLQVLAVAGGPAAGTSVSRDLSPLRGCQHAVILSDANSLFIPWILDVDRGEGVSPGVVRPLSGMFLRILTNPAAVDTATGAVRVSPHHGATHGSAAPPHDCPRCHPNLCKLTALRRLLDDQASRGVSYRQVVYVGDGRNDLCPCLGLGPGDVAMPRRGFPLHKLL
ncbi:hypothetical protein VOLCADRAFT_33391, partial [Volvox carteri f. nagariensis]